MHRYRIVHVYDSLDGITETNIGSQSGLELLDALNVITTLGESIESVDRTTDPNIIVVGASKGYGHYNLVRVSE